MSDVYAQAARDNLETLRVLAESHPAHLKYLEALVVAMDARTELMDVDLPPGVSDRIADALMNDLFWIEAARDRPADAPGHMSQYPRDYEKRRLADARAASARKWTQERDLVLDDLFRF